MARFEPTVANMSAWLGLMVLRATQYRFWPLSSFTMLDTRYLPLLPCPLGSASASALRFFLQFLVLILQYTAPSLPLLSVVYFSRAHLLLEKRNL